MTKTKAQINGKKSKTLPNSHYRFNIKQRLATVDPLKAKNIKDKVVEDTGRSPSTVYRVIRAPKEFDSLADVEVLRAFAKAFNCNIDDLINP